MVVEIADAAAASTYVLLGGILGIICLVIGVWIMPKIINALTPKIDEEREILRGNVAVAQYFGSVVHAMIIGLSIIIAAAIIAGIHGW